MRKIRQNKKMNLLSISKSVFIVMLAFTCVNVKAQEVRQSGLLADTVGMALDGTHVLYVQLTPTDSLGDGLIDCSFTLSQDSISGWGDYSTSIRFNNVDDDGTADIDFRNDGDFMADQLVEFFLGDMYEFWVELDVLENLYSVHVFTPISSALEQMATDYYFRKQNVTALNYWSLLTNPTISAQNVLSVGKIALVDAVGDVPAEPVGISTNNAELSTSVFPNPFTDFVKVNLEGTFTYQVYSLSGSLISQGVANSNEAIGQDLNKGSYILNVVDDENVYNMKLIKH